MKQLILAHFTVVLSHMFVYQCVLTSASKRIYRTYATALPYYLMPQTRLTRPRAARKAPCEAAARVLNCSCPVRQYTKSTFS